MFPHLKTDKLFTIYNTYALIETITNNENIKFYNMYAMDVMYKGKDGKELITSINST